MMAFGWASIMLCLGVLFRAKVSIFRNMLVPASVLGGVLGIIFMNVAHVANINVGTDAQMYTTVVNNLFTISFISISLTSSPKGNGNGTKQIAQGAIGMGIIWCLLYALTPLIGTVIIGFAGRSVNMNATYGLLIPFAFCQGPGQAAAFGSIFEQYGWNDAAMVAITFAAIGFIVAFVIGIPAAKYGIKRGIAKHCGKIEPTLLKGYLNTDEQTGIPIKDTTCNSNIETLAFHFALIGLCYILAVGISKILSLLPGFLGSSISGMMFMNGMYAAYIVKWLMKIFHLDFLQENMLQSKITGWSADYLVVCSFMAVSLNVIQRWMRPIIVETIIITIVTMAICFYFGQRIGGKNDFERTIGLFGTCTGTVPSGVALIRIIDPKFQTTTVVELGVMNLVMLLSTPAYIVILAVASRTISIAIALLILAGCCLVYLLLLKMTCTWRSKTFSWKGDINENNLLWRANHNDGKSEGRAGSDIS